MERLPVTMAFCKILRTPRSCSSSLRSHANSCWHLAISTEEAEEATDAAVDAADDVAREDCPKTVPVGEEGDGRARFGHGTMLSLW